MSGSLLARLLDAAKPVATSPRALAALAVVGGVAVVGASLLRQRTVAVSLVGIDSPGDVSPHELSPHSRFRLLHSGSSSSSGGGGGGGSSGSLTLQPAVASTAAAPSAIDASGKTLARRIVERCPSLQPGGYKAAAWSIWNGHISTLVGAYLHRPPGVRYSRESVPMPDGGTVYIDWVEPYKNATPPTTPTVLLLQGLNGGSSSNYMRGMALALTEREGLRVVAMNFRGANSPLHTPHSYCGAYTGDIRHVVALLGRQFPESPIILLGFSLGSNLMVKFLGEEGDANPQLLAGFSVCNPLDFVVTADLLDRALTYNRFMTKGLVGFAKRHADVLRRHPTAQIDRGIAAQRLRDYDDAITRHIFGYASAEDYYRDASCIRLLDRVRVPLLMLEAADDPSVATTRLVPEAARLSHGNPFVMQATAERGGHVGFPMGAWPVGPNATYAEQLAIEFIRAVVAEADAQLAAAAAATAVC